MISGDAEYAGVGSMAVIEDNTRPHSIGMKARVEYELLFGSTHPYGKYPEAVCGGKSECVEAKREEVGQPRREGEARRPEIV